MTACTGEDHAELISNADVTQYQFYSYAFHA